MIDLFLFFEFAKSWLRSKKFWAFVLLLLACGFISLFGIFHIVTGSDYRGPAFVQKLSFGFAETFVNTDQIGGMPYFAARTQYPLSFLALQRAGYFETDEERDTRLKAEAKVAMDRMQAELMENFQKNQAALKDTLEKLQREADSSQ